MQFSRLLINETRVISRINDLIESQKMLGIFESVKKVKKIPSKSISRITNVGMFAD